MMKSLVALFCIGAAFAQPVRIFTSVDTFTLTSDGIEIHSGSAVIRIAALRDDVLRFRLGPQGNLPEDASWAVLPAARTARVTVTALSDGTAVGFSTAKLRVRVERTSLRMTISDLEGHVISSDTPGRPLEYHGDSFRIYKDMPQDEHYFGLGDKTGPLDRRGMAFTLWNTDTGFQESTDPIYKSIPFFIGLRAGRSYGLLFDNTWRSSFDFGKEVRDSYSFGAEGGPIDYYFLEGPDPKYVVETYAWLTGTAPLPPLWTLGFQQSRYSYETDAKLRQIATRLRTDHIPADVLYLDIDYQNKNRPFTVNDKAFPDFPKLISDMTAQHFHTVLITDLHIANLPNSDYAPYDEGIKGDHFLKNPDGTVYTGIVWPGPAVFPDFTQQAAREWWGTLYKNFYSLGAAGFWNDMNEPAVFQSPTKTIPLDVRDRIEEPGFETRITTQREIHNVFGMENSRATYEGLLKLKPNQRPFVLTRASYAGGQRYAATWTGDNRSTWNHLRLSIPMLLNLGLSGFAIAGDDIGGFSGSPPMDLLTKWIEIGAFNPIFRDHTEKGTNPQEPWVGGPAQEAIRRRFIEERYRLMPYIYTLAEENSRDGMPLMRPLFLEFPSVDIDPGNEFMWGPSILVAPAMFQEDPQSYRVKLPTGDWYDYWTGKKVTGKAPGGDPVITGAAKGPPAIIEVEIKPALAELPVYVRGGSIIPLQPLVQSTSEKPQGPLELRVYPGANCGGSIYQDDGTSFAYKQGEFLRQAFECQVAAGEVLVKFGKREGTWTPWWKQAEVVLYGQTANANVTLNGKPIAGSKYDALHEILRINIPDPAEAGELRVKSK
ncbi:MAG: glycoside hydrolase family 31 protein [Bryobacteraceae bacterium]